MLAALTAAIAATMALPMPAAGHSTLVQAGPAATLTGSAAAVIGGTRWPGRGIVRIRYINATDERWHVERAAKAWNTSGARVRFVAVRRERAQVLITNFPLPPSDYVLSGLASVGYIYPGGGYVRLSQLAHPGRPHFTMARVATHELGHVLGLSHEDRRCATMNSVAAARCSGPRPCRLLERDDLRGATRLYGGRPRMVTPGFCPKPPASIRETGDPRAYGVTLEWKNRRGPFTERIEVARGRGECPKSRNDLVGTFDGETAGGRLVDRDFADGARLRTGRYCYAFWSAGAQNLASRRATVWADFNPSRPKAPTGLRVTAGLGGLVSLSWLVDDHPELESVEGAGALGRCPTAPGGAEDIPFLDAGAGSATVQLPGPGRYCFVVWARDSVGALTGPSEPVFIDLLPVISQDY